MLRAVVATIVGVVVAVFFVGTIEGLGHFVFPPPPGVDPNNPEQLAKLINAMPLGALLFVVAAWIIGAFCGALAATRIATNSAPVPALVVGAVVTLSILYTFYIIPHPLWMMAAGLALPLPTAWAAARLTGQ